MTIDVNPDILVWARETAGLSVAVNGGVISCH